MHALTMFPNHYRQRQVSETDQRACFICYRPSCTVLVNTTPAADFFYVCASHLKDKGFAKPVSGTASELKKVPAVPPKPADPERTKLADEIANLKKEWDAVKGSDDAKDTKPVTTPPPANDSTTDAVESPVPAGPKFFELNPQVFTLRLQAKKRANQERKTKQILATTAFPDVPNHKPVNISSKKSTE